MGCMARSSLRLKAKTRLQHERDYVVVLSDFSEEHSSDIMANLKKSSDYYANARLTVGDFFTDIKERGWEGVEGCQRLGRYADDAYRSGRCHGLYVPHQRQIAGTKLDGIFKPGEKVRLRFINASAMSFFDVRIPGPKDERGAS
jgi:FtsP/CotA-like multicopper oxidase with cupredoxin domain